MATEQPHRPWYRGLILRGELAKQYEIKPCNPAKEEATHIDGPQDELWLEHLAPITIFVGANNSGKSRLLRGLFGDPKLVDWFRVEPPSSQNIADRVKRLLQRVGGEIESCLDSEDSIEHSQQIRRLKLLVPDGWLYKPLLETLAEWSAPYPSLEAFQADPRIGNPDTWNEKEEAVQGFLGLIESGSVLRHLVSMLEPSRHYIPMLRGMRPLSAASEGQEQEADGQDVYASRTYQDYFVKCAWPTNDAQSKVHEARSGIKKRPRIFTGLGIYRDMQQRLLSPNQAERDSIRTYQEFLSEHFFSGQPVTLTPALHRLDGQDKRTSNNVVYLKIGDSDDRPIHDLGDGMQSLIICTYPIVTELKKGSLFFLEEPDLCMHPSLQRIFLNALRNYHRNEGHQFFLTTHSNHLLDMLADDPMVSIFSFSKAESTAPLLSEQATDQSNSQAQDFFRIRHSSQWDRRILSQLGVRPSATYLANATIWVEGTSDCSYLRAYMKGFIAYLELRGDERFKNIAKQLACYKEDRHYAFVEYNGANLVHFNFEESEEANVKGIPSTGLNVAYLCSQALVIADGDIAGKADRVAVFAEQLNERFIVLPVKEIENLIPEVALHNQVNADRKRKRDSKGWPQNYNQLPYMNYSIRSGSQGNRASAGLGYQLEKRKFIGYNTKSGTLKPADKARWACKDDGIPRRLNELIRESSAGEKRIESIESLQLPPYLNQDLIWICLLIYEHVAKLNHDTGICKDLSQFKSWISLRHSNGIIYGSRSQSSDRNDPNVDLSELKPLPTSSLAWPIPNPSMSNSQACLLSQFLRSL